MDSRVEIYKQEEERIVPWSLSVGKIRICVFLILIITQLFDVGWADKLIRKLEFL